MPVGPSPIDTLAAHVVGPVVTDGDERQRLFDAQAAAMPQFAEYETSAAEAGRVIPVFRLVRD